MHSTWTAMELAELKQDCTEASLDIYKYMTILACPCMCTHQHASQKLMLKTHKGMDHLLRLLLAGYSTLLRAFGLRFLLKELNQGE